LAQMGGGEEVLVGQVDKALPMCYIEALHPAGPL